MNVEIYTYELKAEGDRTNLSKLNCLAVKLLIYALFVQKKFPMNERTNKCYFLHSNLF